jgi:hypothetical protein
MNLIALNIQLDINMSNKYKGWYDVQDSKGVWRLGKCIEQKGDNSVIQTVLCSFISMVGAANTIQYESNN